MTCLVDQPPSLNVNFCFDFRLGIKETYEKETKIQRVVLSSSFNKEKPAIGNVKNGIQPIIGLTTGALETPSPVRRLNGPNGSWPNSTIASNVIIHQLI